MNTTFNTSRGRRETGRNSQETHNFIGHHPAECRTQHGVRYGSVNRQRTNRIVSFVDAWDEAIARKGLDKVHFPTPQEIAVSGVEQARAKAAQRRAGALNLIKA